VTNALPLRETTRDVMVENVRALTTEEAVRSGAYGRVREQLKAAVGPALNGFAFTGTGLVSMDPRGEEPVANHPLASHLPSSLRQPQVHPAQPAASALYAAKVKRILERRRGGR
jgi:hypothetical protein